MSEKKTRNRSATPIEIRIQRWIIIAENGCHEWWGSCTGSSQLQPVTNLHLGHRKNKLIYVSRFILAKKLGRAIREGYLACHTCDNSLCVNENHLYEGTRSNNIKDAYDRGRRTPPSRWKH